MSKSSIITAANQTQHKRRSAVKEALFIASIWLSVALFIAMLYVQFK